MNRIMTVAVLLLLSGIAYGQNKLETGNDYLMSCQVEDMRKTPNQLFPICIGYVRGLRDGIQIVSIARKEHEPYCMDTEVTTEQLMRVLEKWIKNHPEMAHHIIPGLYLAAMQDGFPCSAPK